MRRAHLISILLVPLVAAGCLGRGGHPATTATTVAETTTASAQPMHLTVFAMRSGRLQALDIQAPATQATAAASLSALGINAGVTISGGTATVDLPNAAPQQIAEIVYTLTQYSTVQRVDVGGKTGLTRADVDQYLPQISIESPAVAGVVPQTFHVKGTAQVFEATFVVELKIGSHIAVKKSVMASEGAPGRGTFDAVITSPSPGPAEIVAYEASAEDGRPLHTVHVPITVAQ
jgi:hypothetical protein